MSNGVGNKTSNGVRNKTPFSSGSINNKIVIIGYKIFFNKLYNNCKKINATIDIQYNDMRGCI